MATKELGDTYDIICIGSGMGSLTVASLLSQFASKKILVIEKHFQLLDQNLRYLHKLLNKGY